MTTVATALIVILILSPVAWAMFKFFGLVLLFFIWVGLYEFLIYLDRRKAKKNEQ
jgi:uncharacterized membrane protein